MTEEKILTKEIAQQFLEDEDSVNLEEFTSIECLSKYSSSLSLDGLTELSDAAAESLSKHSERTRQLVAFVKLLRHSKSAAKILRDAGKE